MYFFDIFIRFTYVTLSCVYLAFAAVQISRLVREGHFLNGERRGTFSVRWVVKIPEEVHVRIAHKFDKLETSFD